MATAIAVENVIRVWNKIGLPTWESRHPHATIEWAKKIRHTLDLMSGLSREYGQVLDAFPDVKGQLKNVKKKVDSIHAYSSRVGCRDKRFPLPYYSELNGDIDAEIIELKGMVDTCYFLFTVFTGTKTDAAADLERARLSTQVTVTSRPSMDSIENVVALYLDEPEDQNSTPTQSIYGESALPRGSPPASIFTAYFPSYVPSIVESLQERNHNAFAAALAARSVGAFTETVTASTDSVGTAFFMRSEVEEWCAVEAGE